MRTAVQQQIAALQPHYRAALARGQVDTNPIADYLDRNIGSATGATQDHLQRIRSALDGNPGKLDPHPTRLGTVRRHVANSLRANAGTPSLEPDTARHFKAINRMASDELRAKVPGIARLDAVRAKLTAAQRVQSNPRNRIAQQLLLQAR